MKKILTTIGLSLLLLANAAPVTHAIDPSFRPSNAPFPLTEELSTHGENYQEQEQTAIDGTILVLQIIAGGLIYFAAPMALIMIGLGAFDLVVFGADSEKVESAKKHFTWSIAGLFIIILSYSLTKILIGFVIAVASKT